MAFFFALALFTVAGAAYSDYELTRPQFEQRRILRDYVAYYNEISTYRSLDKDAPVSRPIQRIGTINSHGILGGLHHHYVRV